MNITDHTFLFTESAACIKSGPYTDVFAACLILSDSSVDLHMEAMYSIEPSDAFESFSLLPDYEIRCKDKKHIHDKNVFH
jgi:hypothetical protein